jgi:hypothetical protein
MEKTDEVEDFRNIEGEIISVADSRGIKPTCQSKFAEILASLRHSSGYFSDGRDVSFWRRGGVLHYCIQGTVVALPDEFKESASEFQGIYQESGTLTGFEQAIQLLEAWLTQRQEVDQLPPRQIRKRGI